MFAASYFAKTYFAGRYYPPVQGVIPPITGDQVQFIIMLQIMSKMGQR